MFGKNFIVHPLVFKMFDHCDHQNKPDLVMLQKATSYRQTPVPPRGLPRFKPRHLEHFVQLFLHCFGGQQTSHNIAFADLATDLQQPMHLRTPRHPSDQAPRGKTTPLISKNPSLRHGKTPNAKAVIQWVLV